MVDRARLHALLDIMLDDDIPLRAQGISGIRMQSGGGPGVYFILFTSLEELSELLRGIGNAFAQAIPNILADTCGGMKVEFGTPSCLDTEIDERLKKPRPSAN